MQAAQLHHRVPCWGYAVQEAPLPPAVHADAAQKLGISADAVLAALSRDGLQADLTLPDGSKVRILKFLVSVEATSFVHIVYCHLLRVCGCFG